MSLVPQSSCLEIEYSPKDVAWKLYPPRLKKECHEVFVDNDLIIRKPLEEITWFLSHDDAFIMTRGLKRLFGRRDGLVPANVTLNSGFFGIPPHFDFAQAINDVCKGDLERCWYDRYDEQGTVAAIVSKHKHQIIPLEKISNCMNRFIPGTHGEHFCGINSGYIDSWRDYAKHIYHLL